MSSTLRLRRAVVLAVSATAVSMAVPVTGQTTTSWSAPLTGYWLDGTKWSTSPTYPHDSPSQTYKVNIGAGGSPYTVTFGDFGGSSPGTVTVHGVTINSADATLAVQSGTLQMSNGTALQVNAGRLVLDSLSPGTVGTISGLISDIGGTVDLYRGILRDVYFDATYNVRVLGSSFGDGVIVRNSTAGIGGAFSTISFQQASAAAPARLTFDTSAIADPESYAGGGTFVFDSPGAANSVFAVTGGGTLRGGDIYITTGFGGDGTIDLTNGYFENVGGVSAEGPGRSIHITSADFGKSKFTSLSTVNAGYGGAVYVETSFDADPFDDGSSLGVFSAHDNGTIYLGDTRPGAPAYSAADLGLLEASTGGKIVLRGSIDLSKQALNTSNLAKDLYLADLTAINGNMNAGVGQRFRASGNVTFDRVGIAGAGFVAFDPGSVLTIKTKLTLNSTLYLQGSTLTTSGSASITGTGGISLSGAAPITFQPGITLPGTIAPAAGSTLTLGSGLKISGNGTIGSTSPNSPTTSAATLSGNLTLANFTNNGQVNPSGTTVVTSGMFVNNGTVTVSNSGTLSLRGTWSSPGPITMSNSRVNFGGTFTTASLPNFTRSGGSVYLDGTLQNTGTTFTLNNNTGSWYVAAGARVIGGTISSAAGQTFTTVGDAELSGVTVAMPLVVTDSTLSFTNGTALAAGGSVSLAGSDPNLDSVLLLDGPTLGNVGEVTFDSASAARARVRTSAAAGLTIAPGITVRTKTGSGTVGDNSNPLVNNGAVSARTNGTTLVLSGSSITNNGLLEVTAGTLMATAGINLGTGSTFRVGGGTLSNVTVTGGPGASFYADPAYSASGAVATLDTVTVGTAFEPRNGSNSFAARVINGLTLDGGTVDFAHGSLLFDGTQTLGGTGQLINPWLNSQNGVLTIGPGITMLLNQGYAGFTSLNTGSGYPAINSYATITATGTGIPNIAGGPFYNYGSISSQYGASIYGFDNRGTFDIAGGVTTFGGAWANHGTINLTNTAAYLGGSFTYDDLVSLRTTGGSVAITGTLDNTGHTLVLDAIPGGAAWPIGDQGTIKGGTVTAANPGGLAVAYTLGSGYPYGTFDNVTLDANLAIPYSFGLTVRNSLTLAAGRRITIGTATPYGAIMTHGAASINGPGEIVFDANGLVTPYDGSLVLGPSLTIRTGLAGGTVGADALAFTNQGLILSQTPGQTLTLTGTNWVNQGTLQATNGSSLNLTGSYSFAPGSLLHATGGGTVTLAGTFTNTGQTIAAEPTGTIVLAGTVKGGTLAASPAASFLVAYPTLDAVTLVGPFALNNTALTARNTLTLDNATLTLDGSDGHSSSLAFDGSQHLAGTGVVILNGHRQYAYDYPGRVRPTAGALTIDPGITVRTGNFSGVVGNASLPLVNQGTLSAQTPGYSLTLESSGGVNQGTLAASNNSSLAFAGPWTNTGSITASGGGAVTTADTFVNNGSVVVSDGGSFTTTGTFTNNGTISVTNSGVLTLHGNWASTVGAVTMADAQVNFGGTFTPAALAHFTRSSGAVYLDGTLDNTGYTFPLNAVTASWKMAGGSKIMNGTVAAADGQFLTVVGDAELSGVTIATPVLVNYGSLTLSNNASLVSASSITVAPVDTSRQMILQVNSPVLGGSGEIVFDNATSAATNRLLGPAGGLTIGSGITVRTGTGSGNVGSTAVPFNIQGKVSARTAGQTLGVFASTLGNAGTAEATAGATLNLSATGSLTNAGTIAATAGGVVNITAPWTNTGVISADHGTIALGGTAPASIGTVSLTSSTLRISGTGYTAAHVRAMALANSTIVVSTNGILDNTGDTLNLSPAVATLTLGGGQIKGGTISGPAGTTVLGTAPATSSTLSGLVLAADAVVGPSASVIFSNGLTLDHSQVSLTPGPLGPASSSANLVASGTQTLGGTGTITFDGDNGTTGSAVVRPSSGTLTIGADVTIRTGTNSGFVGLSTFASPLVINGTVSAETAGTKVTVFGAPLTNNGSLRASNAATLAITAAAFTNSGTITVDPTSTLLMTGGSATPNGKISLAGNAVLNYTGTSPAGAVQQQLALGRNGLTGVILPAAASDLTRAIAYVEAAVLLNLSGTQTATWSGQTVDATTLLLKPTFFGDANVDGVVSADDYALLDRGMAKGLTGWANGDFNYDGQVTTADYLLIDTTFARQSGGTSAAFLADREARFGTDYVTALVTSVPEPSSAFGVLTGFAAFRRRRRTGRKLA